MGVGAERPKTWGGSSQKLGRIDRVWGGRGADRPGADRLWGGSTGTHLYKRSATSTACHARYMSRSWAVAEIWPFDMAIWPSGLPIGLASGHWPQNTWPLMTLNGLNIHFTQYFY